jgi:hypothetical protein
VPDLALDRDGPSVQSHQLGGDRQPQPGATRVSAAGHIRPVEAVEHMGQMLGGDTGPGASDGDLQVGAGTVEPHRHRATPVGVTDGIVEQVADHLECHPGSLRRGTVGMRGSFQQIPRVRGRGCAGYDREPSSRRTRP